jgi:outer membrane protein assembly factor BamB
MLGGLLIVPVALAKGPFPPFDSPPSLVTSSIIAPGADGVLPNGTNSWITNASFSYPTYGPGSTFYAYVDVINVTQLLGYQVGFTFNSTYLQVTNITDTGYLASAGGTVLASFGFADHGLSSVYNKTGDVYAVGEELSTGPYVTGSGALVKVGFKINTFSPPYTPPAPGGFVSMMHFNVTSGDNHELILTSSDGTDITPPLSQINHGFFKLAVTVTPPVASFTMSPPSPNSYNATKGLESFDASGSTPGSTGSPPSPLISYYCWNFGDGSKLNTTNPKTSHTYAAPPPLPKNNTWVITLVVNNTASIFSAPVSQNLVVEYTKVIPLSVSISPSSATLDVGQSEPFTSSVSGGTPPYFYQWFLNGAAVPSATSSSWTFTPSSSGLYTVYLNVTDSLGVKAESNVASVTVNPALSVGISPSVTFLAPGQSQIFTSAASGGTLPYAYQWYLNGSAESGATGASWNFSSPSASLDIIYLKVTDSVEAQATSNTASVNDWWPMFHHDLTHTGTSTSTMPNTNQTLWSFTSSFAVTSSPTVTNGVVYVGSNNDNVYALNATTGILLWSYTTGGTVESSPAVAGGMLFVGATDGKVYALNATTGTLIWITPIGFEADSSPAASNGMVFVDSWDGITRNGMIYALNASTGAAIWRYTTPGPWPTKSSPAVAGDMVFVGAGDDNVYALNALTGHRAWNFTTGGMVESSPSVAGGIVYVGSYDNQTYALNAATGALVWKFRTGGPVFSSPAVAGGMVFVGSDDGKVYALDASTGTFLWSYATHGMVESSPAVAGGMVFVGSDNGKVYALGRPPYSVTVKAYSITNSADLNVPITMDGLPTGYTTPHTFTGLTGTHSFMVPNANSSQPFKQWNTGETVTTVIVASGGVETAYYRVLPAVDASGVVGITGYKLVFEETLNNSLSSSETVSYYWCFTVAKWNGTQWAPTGIMGSSTLVTGYVIQALTQKNLPYYVYDVNSSYPNAIAWGDWLKVSYTFHWTYSSISYSIACVAKLNVHPGDIAGAALTFPYLGADGRVNILDLTLIAVNWLKPVPSGTDPTLALARADINGDGMVNMKDVTILALNWMQTWVNIPPG